MATEQGIHTFTIEDPSAAGEARRGAVALAASLGFSERRSGELAIIVSEAAKNVAVHARRGEVLIRPLIAADAVGIEVLAIDTGPGMADVVACRRDGYSTAGTAGIGLGAIERLSSSFDVHSTAGKGTVLLSTVWNGPRPADQGREGWEIGVVSAAMPGQQECGDGWAVHQTPGRSVAMVVDGLGHGPSAREASREAERVFADEADRPGTALLELMDGALRATRGASVAIAECDWAARTLSVTGVGNISVAVLSGGESRSAVSHNGTVGHNVRKIQTFTYPFPRDATLVMYSDGLTSQTRADAYPGLLLRAPSLIAGVLYRDFRRGRDDATVLVAREPEARESEGRDAARGAGS